MIHKTTRRYFLKTAAVAAGALTIGRPAFAIQSKRSDSDRFGGFRMGLQTYTFRNFSADDALDMAKDLGFTTVEMFEAHFPSKSTPDEIAVRKNDLADLDIELLAHGVNPFTKDHAANRRWFEFAKAAGIRNITADPTEDAFDSLDKLVAEYDIRVAIHNHGPGARYDKVADVLNAIRGRHPNIGACADLGHYIRSAEDPVRVINLLKGRLYGVHLKDFAEQKRDTHGVILGQGQLDLVGVFRALKQADFPPDACLALEYEEKPESPVPDVKACVDAASEAAQKA